MVAAMFVYIIVPAALFLGEVNEVAQEKSSLLYRALKMSLMASGVLVLVWRSALAARLLREVNVFLLAFVALTLLSATWSIEPGITLWNSVLLYIDCGVCVAFAIVGWYPRRFQSVMRPLLIGFLVASLILGALKPGLGQEQGTSAELAGAWRGVFAQKNGLGHAATLAAIFCLHAWLARETRFWRSAAGIGICIICLILARSSTSLLATAFVTLLLFLLMLAKGPAGRLRYVVPLTTLFVALILFYSLAVLNIVPGLDFVLKPVVGMTGKDMTFTGRTQIWDVVREHSKAHPILGTGYTAYWIGPLPRSPSSVFIKGYSKYYPSEAHNGYLDVINDLGYVGLICLLGYIIVYLWQSLVLLRTDYAQGVLYLALLFEELIRDLTESEWFSGGMGFVVMILATFMLARAALDRRLRAAPVAWRNPVPTPPRMVIGGSLPQGRLR